MKRKVKAILIICLGVIGMFLPIIPAIILIPIGTRMLIKKEE